MQGETLLSYGTLHRAPLPGGVGKQLIEKLSKKLKKHYYSYLLPERGNISSEGNQGAVTDPAQLNSAANNLDARPENALTKCVNDRIRESLLSSRRPGSQSKTQAELENIKLEKCCTTETMKL